MPNESKTLEDQSALYEGPVKLASAKAKQVLPENQTTRNSYDVDPNLDFKMNIEKSRARITKARLEAQPEYEFQEYPKSVSKKDKDGKHVTAVVHSKEAEDSFHAEENMVGVDEFDSHRFDVHGNEVSRLVTPGVEPEVFKPAHTVVYEAKEELRDYPKPPADYTAKELLDMKPEDVPDYTNLPSDEIPEAAKPKE